MILSSATFSIEIHTACHCKLSVTLFAPAGDQCITTEYLHPTHSRILYKISEPCVWLQGLVIFACFKTYFFEFPKLLTLNFKSRTPVFLKN